MKQPKDFDGLFFFLKKYIPNLKKIKWEKEDGIDYKLLLVLETISNGLITLKANFYRKDKNDNVTHWSGNLFLIDYPTIESFCKMWGGCAFALPTHYYDYVIIPKHLPKDEIEIKIAEMCS